jgi:hypothetical protein
MDNIQKTNSIDAGSTNGKNSFIMTSRCRCGQCELNIHWDTSTTSTDITKPNGTNSFDCYCVNCRIYHGGVFTSYLEVSDNQVQLIKQANIKYYTDKCDEIGSKITRLFCSQCYCKLATTATATTTITTTTLDTTKETVRKWFINMGCIVDQTIRADYSIYWRTNRICKQLQQAAKWYPAQPKYDNINTNNNNQTQTVLTGGCACGNAQFKITPNIDIPNELPHCYCHLCREMSGTAFVSWLYITPKNFIWTTIEPKLIRTTSFGQRHVCESCGVVLTIVYDDKIHNDYIYPTAASIRQLQNIDQYLESVTHIYCQDNAMWYEFPNDGLPRYYEE